MAGNQCPDESGDENQEGYSGQEEVRAVHAKYNDDKAKHDERYSRPGRPKGDITENFPVVPHDEDGEERYEEAVGVVGEIVPVEYELGRHAKVDCDDQRSDHGVRQPGLNSEATGLGSSRFDSLIVRFSCQRFGFDGPSLRTASHRTWDDILH